MVETRSGKMQDPAQERIQAEESAKPQPGATIGRDASFDPVVLNPNIDIPKYDGTEDPRPWIESLEEIGFLYHWADYIISRYAAMNMTGSAKTWLNLHKASFTSWENIKIRLIQDFSLDANKEELRMKLNRMQHWNEPAIRFAEDILVLCNKVDPAMEEETKIEHVIGGLKKEYSFALYLNPPKTTDDLLVVCKKMDSFEKKYRERVEKSRNLYNGPRYSRPQQQSRYVPPTAARNYQTTSRPQAPVSNNYKNDSPPTPRQYRNNFPQPSTPRRPYNPNFVPKPNLQRNTYNKSQEVSKNRTEDGRPICFKCNKPGHVARYCRVKFIRILEEDPADTQEKVEEKCQMNEISEKSGPRLYADYAGQWNNKNQQQFKGQQQYNKGNNNQQYNMSQQQHNKVQQYNQGKLILSNLHYKVTNQDIFDLFRSYGNILSYTIHYNASGKSFGMAEVVFKRKDAAIQALQRYNGEFLDGRKMHIKLEDAQQKTSSIKDRLGPFPQKRKQVQDQRGPQNKRIRLQEQEFRTEKFPKKEIVHVKFADDPQKTNTIKNRMDSFPQKWKIFQYQNNRQNKIINLKETQMSTKESAQNVVHLKLEDNTQKNSSIKEQLGPSSQENEQERYAMSEHRGSKNHQNKKLRKLPNQYRRQQYAGQWNNKNQQQFKGQQQYNKGNNNQQYNMSKQQHNKGKLILSNLHYKVTNQDIFDLFRSYGKILSYTIHYNASGKSLGIAEVVFDRKDAAIKALQRYNGEFLDGRKMNIKLEDARHKTSSIKDRLGPFPQKRKLVQDHRGPQNKRIRLQEQEFRTEKFPKKEIVHVKFADVPQKTNTIKNRMDSFPQKWKKFQYQNNPQNKIINLKETQMSTKESAQKEVVHLKLEDNTQKNSSIKEHLSPSSQENEQ
ncbi:ALYREF, partial [Cordylochernes scorpioides]